MSVYEGQAIPPSGTPQHPTGMAVAGFLAAAALGALAAGLCVATTVLPLAIIGSFAGGPLAGLLLWRALRDSQHYFARGALIFAIVSFLMEGGCTIVWGLSMG